MLLQPVETLQQDLRYAVRSMASNKTFTALAVLCLALGIGANTTIFSFMESVLFRSLPVERPESLVVLKWRVAEAPTPDTSPIRLLRGVLTEGNPGSISDVWPYPAFEMFEDTDTVFASVFGRQTPCARVLSASFVWLVASRASSLFCAIVASFSACFAFLSYLS